MKQINDESITEEQCLQKHEKLIWSVVRKYTKSAQAAKMEWGDLYNVGAIGLIKAYRRFDSDYGVKFSTYAVPMIQGEIQRMIRDHGRVIRPSRKSFEIYALIKRNDLFDKRPEEIADEIDVSKEQVVMALNSMQHVSSIDKPIGDDDQESLSISDMLGEEEDFTHIHVEQFLETLPNNLRIALEMKMKDKTQYEIGEVLGTSQMQISRYLKRIAELYQEWESEDMADRKEEIIHLIKQGWQPKDIAEKLNVKPQKVHNIKYNMKKEGEQVEQPKAEKTENELEYIRLKHDCEQLQKKYDNINKKHKEAVEAFTKASAERDEWEALYNKTEEELQVRERMIDELKKQLQEPVNTEMEKQYFAMKAKHDKLLEYITIQ